MKSILRTILITLAAILLLHIESNCQSVDIGLGLGGSVYNGDLSHHSSLFAGEETNTSITAQIGITINKSWKFRAHYLRTKVEGSDEYATKPTLKMRNLHFWAPINEYAGNFEFHFFPTFEVSTKYISPYISAGMGVFHFRPHASFNNQNYELQPLRTEGQGLPGNNISPYQLIETNYQLGLGFRLKLSENFSLDFNSNLRRLTTDYLDDVSGIYYDINKLAVYKGEIAAKLAYRSDEVSNDLPESVAGLARGNPNNNDSYIIHQVSITYSIPLRKKKAEINSEL